MRKLIAVYSDVTKCIESLHANPSLSDEELAFQFSSNGRSDLHNKTVFLHVNVNPLDVIGKCVHDFETAPLDTMDEFIEQRLTNFPPRYCEFQVGDKVTYTNSYGVEFDELIVIGFSNDSYDNEKYIHLNTDCYWFPVTEDSLQHS